MKFQLPSRKVLATAMVLGLSLSGEILAQGTTSGIRGRVTDANGAPWVDATIVVEDTRTGAIRTLRSNETGSFYATNLPVGGPYRVTIDNNRTVTVDSISLGDIYQLSVALDRSRTVEEIVVIGDANTFVDVASGPAATFSTFDMATSVSFDRDIKDVYVYDPRLNISGETSEINCVGKHPRFNSVSLDGVSQNDRFGLNDNGYSTATGMPFPYEGIAQVAVELAPFDVTYGGFTACNINAVTKSGSNEWTGTAFYERTEDGWRGDSLDVNGTKLDLSSKPYTEETKGFSLGGPLIADTLFIYGAYEESEQPEFLAMGYAGSGNGVERPWLSQSNYDRIVSIANSRYNYNPGGQPGDGVQTDEKYMVRLDWNINASHDAALIYNYYDGIEDRASDDDSNEFEFANHYYKKGAESETTTLKLSSQWTDALSTEFFYSTNTMDDSQVTVGPPDFAEVQINIGSNIVYLGADDSRQANALNTDSSFLKLTGEYLYRDHIITVGYERENLEIFNQFVQHARGGEIRFFDDSGANPASCASLTATGRQTTPGCRLSGIDKFELGIYNRYYYGSGGGTNNAADAAARFENTLNTIYVQDELLFPDHNLTVVAGLRYDWFESDDRPKFNQAFTTLNNGLRNDVNIDGLDLLMPRLGFTWEARTDLTVRGGLGLYSGGNPNVWISNAWSNDGLSNVQLQDRNSGNRSLFGGIPLVGSGRPGYDVPQSLFNTVANTTAANASRNFLVLIDPNYEQPSEWKFALGATYDLPNGMTLDTDYLYSLQNNPAYYVDVSQDIVRRTAAGQPVYDYVRGQDNFMLTNSDREGRGHALSFVLRDRYDWGLDWTVGYAFTDAEDVSPMTSAVAGSNFDNVAVYDINDPYPGTSNYVSPHRFTGRVSYGRDFFPGAETRVTAQYFRAKGQPQSHAMGGDALEGDGFFGRHLLYVPGPNDPNAVLAPGFDLAGFQQFITEFGYGQGFVERNAAYAKWSSRLDLRLDQEVPLFFADSKARVYVKIYNFLNMLNDEWGLQYDNEFFTPQVVNSTLNAQGQYVFQQFNNNGNISDLLESRSLWEMRLGLQFEF